MYNVLYTFSPTKCRDLLISCSCGNSGGLQLDSANIRIFAKCSTTGNLKQANIRASQRVELVDELLQQNDMQVKLVCLERKAYAMRT